MFLSIEKKEKMVMKNLKRKKEKGMCKEKKEKKETAKSLLYCRFPLVLAWENLKYVVVNLTP